MSCATCAGRVGAHVFGAAQRNGLIVGAIGDAVAVCPPLIVTDAQVNIVADPLEKALEETAERGRAEGIE